MADHQSLQQQLEMHRRLLNELESQIAGAGELYATPDKLVARELCREKIAKIEALLNKPIHAYLKRTLEEFERYEDTANIIFPALKPGTVKEKKEAKSDVARVQDFLSGFDPKFSPRNPETLKPNEQAQEVELEAFLLKNTRIVLLGDPGAGKSTALRGLFREYAGRWEKDSAGVVPLFAALNRWQTNETLLEFLQKEAQELGDMLPTLLKDGRVLLLLDGLNELPGGLKRDEKTQEINDPRSKAIAKLSSEYHPKVCCALSCRVKEFAGGPTWCDLHVLPLRREQVEAIARSYLEADTEKAAQLIDRLYAGKQEELQSLAEKPFYLRRLLSFFLALGRLPENPALLLAYSVEQALSEEITKGLLKAGEREELKERLSLLAFNMTDAREVSTTREQAALWFFQLRNRRTLLKRNQVIKALNPQASDLNQAKIWLKKGEGCGLLSLQENKVKFAHQLLQEYFCAIFLKKQGLSKEWMNRTSDGFEEIWPLWSGLEVGLVEKLILALKDEDSLVRYYAAKALGKIGDARAVDLLTLALNDEDNIVRNCAAEALGKIGDARAVEPLILALKDEDSIVRYCAAFALAKIDVARAVEPLILALNDEDGYVRHYAAISLGEIGDARAVEPLILVFKDKDSTMNFVAAKALGMIGAPSVEPLILALKDKDSTVRRNVAIALGKIGDARAVEPLILALKDKDNTVRQYSANTLGDIRDARAVEPLILALKDKDNTVRQNVVIALGEIGDARAIEPLILALNDQVRYYAAKALGDIGDARTVELLILALKDEDSIVRYCAAFALGDIGDARAVEPLILTLNDQDSSVRYHAVEALGKIGDARVVEPLILALKDEDSLVRYYAAKALGKIGDTRAVAPLILALKDEDRFVRQSAVDALGEIGDAKALPELERVVREDKSEALLGYVSDAAAKAIEQIKARQQGQG